MTARLAEAYLNGESSLKALGKSSEISHSLAMTWAERYRRRELTPEVDFIEKQRSYEAHVAALERKIGQPTMKISALKERQRTTSLRADLVSRISVPSASKSPTGGASCASPEAPTTRGPDPEAAFLRDQAQPAMRAAIGKLLVDWPIYRY